MYTLAMFHVAELLNSNGHVRAEVYTQESQNWQSQTLGAAPVSIRQVRNNEGCYHHNGFVFYTPLENVDMTPEQFAALMESLPSIVDERLHEIMQDEVLLDLYATRAGYKNIAQLEDCLPPRGSYSSMQEHAVKGFLAAMPFA